MMQMSQSKYPNYLSQSSVTTKNKYHAWGGLNNLRNGSTSSYAQCGPAYDPILGKSASSHNKPAKFQGKNFGFTIPSHADVTSIVVEYMHSTQPSSSKYANIGAPKVSLYNGSTLVQSKTGTKAGKSAATKKVTFNGLKPSIVNSDNLNIKFEYPSNTSANKGYIRMNVFKVTVNYNLPEYELSINRVDNNVLRKGDTFEAEFILKNKAKTSYNPQATIQLSEGLSYVNKTEGSSVSVDGKTITFDPKLSTSVTESKLKLLLKCDETCISNIVFSTPSPVSTFISKEELIKPVPFNLNYIKTPEELVYTDDEWSLKIYEVHNECYDNTEDEILIKIEDAATNVVIKENGTIINLAPIQETDELGQVFNVYSWLPDTSEELRNDLEVTADLTTATKVESSVQYQTKNQLRSFLTTVIPENVDFPYYSAFILNQQELDRMGSGFVYKIMSQFYVNDPDEFYVDGVLTDYRINHRLAVFNSPLDILVDDPNGRSTTWNITNLIKDESSDIETKYIYDTDLGGEQTTFQAHNLTEDKWSLSTIIELDVDESPQEGYLVIGDIEAKFNKIGISNGTNELKLEFDGNDIYVSVNDEVICILDEYIPGPTDKIGFKSLGCNFSISDYILREDDVEYTEEEIIAHAVNNLIYGNCPEMVEANEEVSVEFTYDETCPVVVFILGEPGNIGSTNVSLNYTTPMISETAQDLVYNTKMNYPENIIDLVNNEDEASVTGDSTPIALYDFSDLEGLTIDESHIVNGIKISFNYDEPDNIIIIAKLHVNGKTGIRTLSVQEGSTQDISIGGEWDKFGLNYSDFSNLENLEIELEVQQSDISDDSPIFTIRDFVLTVYHRTIEENNITATVDGEDLRNYGLWITKIDMPFGFKTNTQYLEVEGTDTNKAFRMNIDKKEITISYSMNDCSLIQNGSNLKQLTKVLSNKRDALNRPIPKRIEFSHFPDDYFEYILEDGIDAEAIINNYEGEIVLTIPSGTGYAKEATVTGNIGTNNGITKTLPQINLKNLTNDISVKLNDETFHIVHPEFTQMDLLEINCDERTCIWYKYNQETEEREAIDVTAYVDINSKWFTLDGEYEFTTVGCDLISVQFYERN